MSNPAAQKVYPRGFTPHRLVQGFTLIELLVVIAIIAILSVVGVAIFTGVQKGARDSKRKADIDAISKVYEVNAGGSGYVAIGDSDFSSGKKPTDPRGSTVDYFNWLDSNGLGFKVCASLDNNPSDACNTPATNCYCKFSSQETIPSGSTAHSSSTQIALGQGGYTDCDPDDVLLSGLVGYWKMDETLWNGTSGEVDDTTSNNNNGTAYNGAAITTGKFGNAGNFDGSNDYVDMGNILGFTNGQLITIAAWIKPNISQTKEFIGKQYNYDFAITNTQRLLFGYYRGDGVDQIYQSPASAITIGSWNHVAVTYTFGIGNSIKMYINGIERAGSWTPPGTGSTAPPSNSNTFQIGSKDTYAGAYFNGLIDDVRIYDWALSQTYISNLYNNGNGCL